MNNLNLSNIDELPENGWGLKILFPITDELSYERTPDDRQNCLRLVKNYSSSSSGILADSSTPRQEIKLEVKSDIAFLENVLAWYQQLEDQPIPKPVWWQCQIALAEGFTNAVNHAHKDLPYTTPIELQISVFNESLEIRIWDYGAPFDLEAEFNSSQQN
ncbi:MAG: ATP-binding protein [Cyanobacteriota bacterium]|nr:ATP-binding protein [Cyanobacteriota bacterium]